MVFGGVSQHIFSSLEVLARWRNWIQFHGKSLSDNLRARVEIYDSGWLQLPGRRAGRIITSLVFLKLENAEIDGPLALKRAVCCLLISNKRDSTNNMRKCCFTRLIFDKHSKKQQILCYFFLIKWNWRKLLGKNVGLIINLKKELIGLLGGWEVEGFRFKPQWGQNTGVLIVERCWGALEQGRDAHIGPSTGPRTALFLSGPRGGRSPPKGTSAVLWRGSGTSHQNTFNVLSTLWFRPGTSCPSAQFPSGWAPTPATNEGFSFYVNMTFILKITSF